MAQDYVLFVGSAGEGGGQILRSALCLSLCTGRPIHIHSIRQRRKKPGLLRQHLCAVSLAQQVGRAEVRGAAMGSRELRFAPRGLHAGEYSASIGTAGSTSLVAQTVIPALLMADGPSRIDLEGGTHNPSSPPFDFLERSYLPAMQEMGADLRAELVRYGFYPAGGGKLRLHVRPSRLGSFERLQRGSIKRITARARVADLSLGIAERELKVLRAKFELHHAEAEEVSNGPGNVLCADVVTDAGTEVFTEFGQPGLSAERVATRLVRELRNYLRVDAPVGPHLADQLLLPMALGGGGSFRTTAPTMHTQTQVQVIEAMLPVSVTLREDGDKAWLATVS